jgi:hypothetical protein
MASTKARIIGGLLGAVLLVVALGAGYLWVALHWSYSGGDRSGIVQKFSQKGWVCKTWEGELLMTAAPGMVPEKFLFTVRSDDMVKRINSTLGKRVILHYEQHKGLPTTCFGETEYFITDLRIAE